jgi:hypothetical protein
VTQDPLQTYQRSGLQNGQHTPVVKSISCNRTQSGGDGMQFDRLKRREFIALFGGATATEELTILDTLPIDRNDYASEKPSASDQ